MIDSYLRAPYQRLLVRPLARQLQRLPMVGANSVTLLGCFFGVLVCPLLAIGWWRLAAGAMLLSGYLDTLDGSLARLASKATPQGAILDICCDRLVETAIVLGLYFVNPTHRGLPCLLILASILLCITSFLVVGIFTENDSEKSFHYSPGIVERAEAFLFFFAMIVLPESFSLLAYTFAALVTLTAVIRVRQYIRKAA